MGANVDLDALAKSLMPKYGIWEGSTHTFRCSDVELRLLIKALKAYAKAKRRGSNAVATGRKIALGKGFKLDKKTGKPVKGQAHLDVSTRLKQAASKKIRVNRGTK